jgi:hypothetical protein
VAILEERVGRLMLADTTFTDDLDTTHERRRA